MVGFERRRRGAEKRDRVFEFGADDGDVAAVVARRFFLLVAGFLFFIDDDEAEIFERRENGGARADDDAGFAVADAPPFAGALYVAERGVKNGDAFEARAEPGAALTTNPQSERNFRDENDGGFSARERFLHGAHVDLGLAAAGDAVEEECAEFAEFEAGFDGVEGGFLAGVEFVGGGFVAGVEGIVGGIDAFFPGFEEAVAEHAFDDGAGDVGEFENVGERQRAAFDELVADACGFFVERRGAGCVVGGCDFQAMTRCVFGLRPRRDSRISMRFCLRRRSIVAASILNFAAAE